MDRSATRRPDAVDRGIRRRIGNRLRRRLQNTRRLGMATSPEHRPVWLDRGRIGAICSRRTAADVGGERSHSIAAGQFDATPAKVQKVTAELGHYSELLGILRDQVGNVSSETEGAALDILTRLNEVDRNIQDMIAFLNHAGSSDKMTDLMDQTEARMAQNVQLLDEFRKSCDRAGAESQEQLRGIHAIVAESTAASDRFATLPSRPASLRSMQRSRRRGPARPARVSPWWPLRSNNCREIPIPRL